MLKVNTLSYHYPNGDGVTDMSFDLNPGEHLAIIGESGCGKSTLIKAVYGLLDLDKGSIHWKDEQILGPAYNLVPGFSKFKHLSQEFDLMPFTTAEENIQKFLSRVNPEQNQERSDELITTFDLEKVKHQKVKTLSGGQKQRVAIAQALAKPPKLILLDEPFSHIDQFLKHKLRRRLFQFLKKENITCIFATHDADDVLPFSDYTLIMKKGKVLDYRPTKVIYQKPKNEYCASLFGDINVLNPGDFEFESEQNKVLIYPHEITFVQASKWVGIVKSCYFKGSHYLVEIEYKSTSIFVVSTHDIKVSTEVNFQLDVDKIKSRLS